MPFEISDQGRFLYARLFGVLSPDDLITLAVETERLEDAAADSKDRIADLSSLDRVEIAFPDVWLLANKRSARSFTHPVKAAVIARDALHIGYARMYQTLNEHPQLEIRIVQSMDEAVSWLTQ